MRCPVVATESFSAMLLCARSYLARSSHGRAYGTNMEKYVNIGSHPLSKRKERGTRKREKEKGDPFARARDCKIQEGTTTPFALLF